MKIKLLAAAAALCLLLTALPTAAFAAGIVDSGSCGESVTWSLDQDGTLTFGGTGETDLMEAEEVPWARYKDSVKAIVVEDEVTGVYQGLLAEYPNLTTVTLGKSFSYLAVNADLPAPFIGCPSLKTFRVSSENGGYEALDGVLFSTGDRRALLTYPSARPDPVYRMPAGVWLYPGAFYGAPHLETVVLPDGFSEIGFYAFAACMSLTGIVAPASLSAIEWLALPGTLTDLYFAGSELEWNFVDIDEFSGIDMDKVTVHTDSPDPFPQCVRSTQILSLNGQEISAEAYNINGYNYLKLRDVAAIVNGSGSQFDVGYDAATRAMTVTTGAAYQKLEGDLAIGAEDKSGTCAVSTNALLVDGMQMDLVAYNIGGYNYFKLRDLGWVADFTVDYDPASKAALILTAGEDGYVPQEEIAAELFARLPDSFSFASGAGAWSTELIVAADGSFTGAYGDSDMGDSGPGYPNGTHYYASFSGQFGKVRKIDEYTYEMLLLSLESEPEAGEITYEDGVRYIGSEPYGIEGAREIVVYLPGKPVNEVPAAVFMWSYGITGFNRREADEIDFSALYNRAEVNCFIGT